MSTTEHLKGLRVPSLESAVRDAVWRLGIGALDLAVDQERLIKALVQSIGMEFQCDLTRAFTDACAKACEHVAALMEDPNYQAKRAVRRKQQGERRKQRITEEAEKTRIAGETYRQQRKGLLQ